MSVCLSFILCWLVRIPSKINLLQFPFQSHRKIIYCGMFQNFLCTNWICKWKDIPSTKICVALPYLDAFSFAVSFDCSFWQSMNLVISLPLPALNQKLFPKQSKIYVIVSWQKYSNYDLYLQSYTFFIYCIYFRANMPSYNNSNNGVSIKHKREELAQENVEKLHRMVLGKDKNINNEYVENFYVDMAKGVSDQNAFCL